DFKSTHYDEPPYAGITVLRSRFDSWLAGKVQEAIDAGEHPEESFIATNILVEEVIKEDGRVVGIRAGKEAFYADVVLLAEGVNNLLTRQIGLQSDYVPAEHVMIGIKEVLRFDRGILEERFQLTGLSGLSNEFVGYCSRGVEGGGFLYTNRESLSVGLVLGIKDVCNKKVKPHDILNDFKAHPVIADMLRGGEEAEYSAHAVSSGDIRIMPRELFDAGVLIAGEAANLLINAGKAIQGMDYAMRSGILAAEAVLRAREAGDFSAASLRSYREALESSFVLKDMRNFQGAVRLLHDPDMYVTFPSFICDFGRRFFTVKDEPTPKTRELLRETIKDHTSYWSLIKLAFKASRSL
ncbi:MAG: electron transfer flavoprotein, partial [Rhodothermales bacterium]